METPSLIQVIGVVMFFQLLGSVYASSSSSNNSGNNSITNIALSSTSNEFTTSNNTRTHTDLIRTCDSFRDIISEDAAYSCDYSMLYYKGQCELYSSMLKNNESQSEHDFSFCSDPRINAYVEEYGLGDAPRSPTLIPFGEATAG